MTAPMDLTVESFQADVEDQPGTVLVDFWSQACPHCQHFNPAFAEAAEHGYPGVRFAKVSVQQALPLFSAHDVTAVPTLVLFRDGVEVARQPGARSAEDVLAWLERQLPAAP